MNSNDPLKPSDRGLSVDVVLPCLDEAAALPGVLARLPHGYRAIVVDNGSRDGSAEVARALGAVIVHESQKGYGAAVDAGLRAATADVVAVMDCDGSMDPADLPAMVDLLRSEDVDHGPGVDLVCGRRRPVESGAWPWHAWLANRALAWLLSVGSGAKLSDIAPVRVASREALLGLDVTDRRCGYPLQTLLLARRSGWRIVERDLAYRRRASGTRSKISGTARGTAIAAYDFIAVLVTS